MPNAVVPQAPKLILASTSTYRRELLGRLKLAFDAVAPEVDEQARVGEHAAELATRLAAAKARAVAARHPGSLVLGSDQVADRGGALLGKPGSRAAAIAQLTASSGQAIEFLTAVCLYDGRTDHALGHLDRTRVRFRLLGRGEIERYVDADAPLDCAGGFRCESLGIALFDSIETADPTALVGLPLIATARMLREAGFHIP